MSDVYEKYFDTFLKCSYDNKKNASEVFTPPSITQLMFNTSIDIKEFTNPNNKWLDNSAGMGHLIKELINLLMEGLANWETDTEKRYKHIVENMIYLGELSELNCYYLRLLIGKNKYKLNLYCGDSLSKNFDNHMKNVWNVQKFNFIVGNPPYNCQIYKKFIHKCLEITDKLLYVIPSNWTVGTSSRKFVNEMKKSGLKDLYFLDKNSFENVDIETLFIYVDKNYKGDTININGVETNKNDNLTNHSNKIEYSIFKKLSKYKSIEHNRGKNKTLNYKNPKETDNVKFEKTKEHCNKLLSRLNGGKGEEIYWIKDYVSNNKNKVVFPRGSASYCSINNLKNLDKDIVYCQYVDKDTIVSNGLIFFNVENKEEGNFFIYYLMRSKLVRYLFLKQNKFGELTKGLCDFIPKVDYKNCESNNESIYKYFKLTEEEIKEIEKYFC
jgi:hypothetical protein